MDHAHMTIDETAVDAFLHDLADATPRVLVRYAIPLEALIRRGDCTRVSGGEISEATLAEALRCLRLRLHEEL